MRITKESIILIAIATICFLGINIYLDLFFYVYELNNQGDALSYQDAAQMLFSDGKVHPTRPIGIAAIFGVLENIHPSLISIFHFLVWIATVFTLYKSLLVITTKRLSFVLSLIFVLCISNIVYIQLELTETLTTFLLVLFSTNILNYSLNKGIKHLLLASTILIFLVLVKPGFYYASILLALLAFWKAWKEKALFKYYIPLIVTLLLLIVNNSMVYKSYGKFKPSFIDDITLYTYLGAYSQTEVRNTSTARIQRERREKIKNLSYSEIHDLAQEDLQFQLQYHPFVVIKYWLKNIQNNAFGGNVLIHTLNKIQNTKGAHKLLDWLSQFQNITMVLISFLIPLFQLVRHRNIDFFLAATTILIWYIILTSGISYYQGDRFHIVFYPMVLIQVAYFLFKKKAINIA